MIRYLIKNNFKLMFRNKWIIFIMVLGPVLVIALLSNAFGELMKSYEKADVFNTGYRISSDSIIAGSIEAIREEADKQGIILTEYTEGDPDELIKKNDLAGFIDIGKDSYIVYESDDNKIEGITFEFFFDKVMNELEKGTLRNMGTIIIAESLSLPETKLEFMPAINAKNYYTMVFIEFFIWCGVICISGVLSSEKKNGIDKRFAVSGISDFKLFLAKFIPAVMMTISEIAATIVILSFITEISWKNIPMTIVIIIMSIIAASVYGLMLYYIFKNLAVTVVSVFLTVWIMGFIGGSFETYMYSSFTEKVMSLSPLYHINRTLVEYSCIGKSAYTDSSIIYMTAIIVICPIIAMLAEAIRKKVKQ